MLLLNDLNQVMNLTNHTHITGGIFNLNNLRNLVKTKREKRSLLIYRSTYTTLNLLYLYCCHCDIQLTVKHLAHFNATLASNLISITHLRQSENCSLNKIMSI